MRICAICGSFRRRVWHPAIPTPPAANPPTEFTEFTEASGVGYSPTDFTDAHRFLGCVIGGVGMAGCHTLLICAHLCLSVGGFLCQNVLCVPRVLWEHSLCLLCWCCRGSCTSVVVFSHGFHGFPQMVRLRYWRRGYGRMPYPPNLCASVSICGRLSLPEGSVCSAYSVGTLSPSAWLVHLRQVHPLRVPPESAPSAIRLRPPSDQIPSAVQSDSVRHPIRLRPLHDAISSVCILRRLRCNTQCVYVLHPFMFAKLRNKFDF